MATIDAFWPPTRQRPDRIRRETDPTPLDSGNLELLRGMYVAHPECTIMRLIATVDCLAEHGADATQEYRRGLTEGARTMRAACSSMLRSVAFQARIQGGICGVMGAVAGDYASAIDALPLPGGADESTAETRR